MSPVQLTVRQQIQKGMAEWEREDYLAARETFETLLSNHPRFPDIRNKLGLCIAMLGDTEKALEQFQKAVELAPDYAEAHFNRGLMLNDLGRHEDAEEAFARASGLDVRDGSEFPSEVGHRIAVTHGQLGDLYMAAGRPELAAEQFRAALKVRARFVDIRDKLAAAFLEMGETEEAVKELEAAISTNPNFAPAHLHLGVALNRMGDNEGAKAAWQACLERDPENERARAYLASLEG